MVLDREWVEPKFQLARRDFDISYTYDGYLIASDRFKDAVEGSGARFAGLPAEPGYYVVEVDAIVRFDAQRRRTRFDKLCVECGRYFGVSGATPVFLLPGEIVPTGKLVRTDLEFGTGDEQHPIVIAGASLARHLEESALSGLSLRAIAG